MHPATESLLSLLRAPVTYKPSAQVFAFHEVASTLVAACDDSPELSAALRHLLNARSFVSRYMGPETPGQCVAMLRVLQGAAQESEQPEARAVVTKCFARLAEQLHWSEQDGQALVFAYGQLFLAEQAALRCAYETVSAEFDDEIEAEPEWAPEPIKAVRSVEGRPEFPGDVAPSAAVAQTEQPGEPEQQG